MTTLRQRVLQAHGLAYLSVVLVSLVLGGILSPMAFATSNTQWHIGFSGTCKVSALCASAIGLPPGTTGGFWGWCDFGGSSADGTTGTSGNCGTTLYVDSPGSKGSTVFHVDEEVTAWFISTGSAFLPQGIPSFFITGGSIETTGPGSPWPNHTVIPLGSVCDLSNPPASLLGNFLCDTGYPSNPGHYSLHPAPGVELNIQVSGKK